MSNIPFMDLKRQYRILSNEIMQALGKVCVDTAFSGGAYVESFEHNFAEYCNVKNAVCVNSGTSALHLALEALEVSEGDEVILPANTFIATAWAVSYCRATPVFVDCLPDTWNIDPTAAEKAINSKTKAIIAVHLYGQPCDIDALRIICSKYNIYLIEDCAQAHGAKYHGKLVGGLGDIGCFSFYPGKNLGAYGEGGAVTTNNSEYAEKVKMLRNHGSKVKYYHAMIGYNMRMDGFQGAILDVKIKYLDKWNKRRKEIAGMYLDGIKNELVTMQSVPVDVESVYHLFVIKCVDSDALEKHLQANGISIGKHYPMPCHLQEAYNNLNYSVGDLINVETLARQCLSLPMFPELTQPEIDHVVNTINAFDCVVD